MERSGEIGREMGIRGMKRGEVQRWGVVMRRVGEEWKDTKGNEREGRREEREEGERGWAGRKIEVE